LFAGFVSQTYTFPEPVLEVRDGYTYVHMEGVPEIANPGQPLLPARGARILLPPGEEVVGVEVVPGTREILPGQHLVAPGQQEYPLSLSGPFEPTLPDTRIYEMASPFPSEAAVYVTTERVRGYDIAFVRLYPVEYTPADGALAYYPSLELRVLTAPSAGGQEEQASMFRGDEQTRRRVGRMIDNTGAEYAYADFLGSFEKGERDSDTYPYLIITDDPYVSTFQDLADYKTSKGLRAKIVRVDSLTANVSGNDNQDRIRNYIIEAYQNLGTEYVLLAGDDEIIPHRGFYAVGGGADYDIAADLYYGALDGNWNTDGDSRWGEPEEADLIPEVHVGRAPVDNTTEATNFVYKTLKYQQDPVVAECDEFLLAGELLWDDPTWGGDYMEELRLGASTHGHTTVGLPNPSEADTLYDRGPSNPTWDKDDIIPLMNAGVNQIHHLGHSNVTYTLRMVNGDVQTRFTNDGDNHTFFVIYTQGCYCGAFDNRWSDGSYGDDAISEYFVTIDAGAVAFVGNSRYGFGAHASTNGSSQRFHRQFVDAMFGEGIFSIGATNDDSKVDVIPFVDMGVNRWCYYQINVQGDPELPLWSEEPVALTLTHDGNCWIGQNEYEIVVESGRGPVAGALACLSTADGDVYATGTTDDAGRVYLDPSPTQSGTASLVVSGHNCLITEESVTIQLSNDPYVIVSATILDDDGSGLSSGDGDGSIEAGETLELDAELENVGETGITGVWATLAAGEGFVQVPFDTSYYGDLPAHSSGLGNPPFVLEVEDRCPDGQEISFDLEIHGSRSHGVRHLFFEVGAPRITMLSYEFSDAASGNGDGCLSGGETVDLIVTVENSGSDDASDIVGTLLPGDPYVTYVVGTAQSASLGIGESTQIEFQVFIETSCPAPYPLSVPLELSASTGEIINDACGTWVPGPLSTDFEDGAEGYWTHEAISDGYVDQWQLVDNKSHDEGTYSWKFGAPPGEGNYADYADGGLITPLVCLSGSDTLEFWHRMRAEDDANNTAWDGGFLEMSVDGGSTWAQITPIGGYPYTIIENPDSPFDPGTPCWSGIQVWEFAEFDLSGVTGPAQFRFRFGSDGYVTEPGWWIDEVVLRTETITGTSDEVVLFGSAPSDFGLSQNRPNPFNPVTTIRYAVAEEGPLSIRIYNVLGQQVITLVEGIRPAGYHEVSWDGTDTRGQEVASGIYFYRMEAGDFGVTKRMILLK
jgi:hypothetical protein